MKPDAINSLIIIMLSAVLLLSGTAAEADDIDEKEPYLQQLIEVALDESYSYQQLEEELQAARHRREQLDRGLDWRGDVIGDMDVIKTPEFIRWAYEDLAGQEIDDQIGIATLNVAASQSLWDDAEIGYQRQALELDIRDSELAYTREEQELITEVAEAYYDLRQAQAGVKLAREAARVREEQIEEKRHLVEAEEATETELEEAKVEAEEARDAVSEAEEMLNIARDNLRLEMGADRLTELPEAPEFAEAEEIEIPEDASPWPWDLDRSREIAREERVDIQRLEQGLDLIDAEKERVEDEHDPDVSANLMYYQPDVESTFNVELDESGQLITAVSRTETTLPELEDVEVEEEDIEELFENGIPSLPGVDEENMFPITVGTSPDPDSAWQIGFSIEYNFYDSGLKEAELDELEAEQRASQQELEEARDGIGVEVKARWQDLEEAHRSLRQSRRELDLAKTRLSDGEYMLEAETISQYDYNLLELNYYQSANEMLISFYEFRQERARMAEVLGLSADWYRGEL